MRPILTVCTAALLLTGCASTNVGKSRYPTAPADFIDKEQHPVGLDTAWRTVEAILDQERLPIVQSDRAGEHLTTEDVRSEAKMIIGIMGTPSFTTRYRYTISLSRASGAATRILLFATLESSKDGQGQWLNITQTKPEDVRVIENWHLNKIETRRSAS